MTNKVTGQVMTLSGKVIEGDKNVVIYVYKLKKIRRTKEVAIIYVDEKVKEIKKPVKTHTKLTIWYPI